MHNTYLMGVGVVQIAMYNLYMEMYQIHQIHQVRQNVRWHLPFGVVASPNMATSLQTPKLHASYFMLHASTQYIVKTHRCFIHHSFTLRGKYGSLQ